MATSDSSQRPAPPNPYERNKDDTDDDDFGKMMKSNESLGSLKRFLPKVPSTPGNMVANIAAGLSPNRNSARRFDFDFEANKINSTSGRSPKHDQLLTPGGSNRLSLVQASVGGVANLVKRMLPRMPSNPPPVDISDEDHAEFERLKAAKTAQRNAATGGAGGGGAKRPPGAPPPPPPPPHAPAPPAKAPSLSTMEKAGAVETEFDRMKREAHERRKLEGELY